MTAIALRFSEVWNATFAGIRRDLGIYLTLAAAFVLLPAVAAAVLGPAPAARVSQTTLSSALLQLGLAVIACIAQIAIVRLSMRGGAVRDALRAGLRLLPLVLASVLLSSFALVPAVALLQGAQLGHRELAPPAIAMLVPGLYVLARLSLALPLIASRPIGPLSALQRSWAATRGNGWRVLLLLFVLIVMLLGVSILGAAVASAIGSVLILAGGKALSGFAVALVSAIGPSLYTLANSVLLGEICRRLARD